MTIKISNYDGGITSCPTKLVYARSVDDIVSVLKSSDRFPSPVRAMGSYHSLTPCVSSSGTIVQMSQMNKVVRIDRRELTFTAEAGMEFIEASRFLRGHGLQFRTNIEIGNMTLGAAACCQTKDGLDGAELGQVNSYVIGIKWVAPDGQLMEATETSDLPRLRFMRSSYGLCGIVYEVTFRIEPLEAIRFTYLPRRIKDLSQDEVNDLTQKSTGMICWTVGGKAHFQMRSPIARPGPFGAVFAAGRRKLWNYAEARVGRFIDSRIPTKPLRHGALDVWFSLNKALMSGLHLIGGGTLYNPDKTVDYSKTKPSAKYAFTFWAFPSGQWLNILREYVEFSEKHFRQHDFRCNMPLGSYFIRKDDSSLLSYTHDGDIFSIDPIHAYSDKKAWDRSLIAFNKFAFDRKGIPLLNQSPFVERKHVEQAYGPRWLEFSQGVRKADPTERMLNPFFADLLSLPQAAAQATSASQPIIPPQPTIVVPPVSAHDHPHHVDQGGGAQP